jgi:hypothetical protein
MYCILIPTPVVSSVSVCRVLEEEGDHVDVAKVAVDGQERRLLQLLRGVVGGSTGE